MVDPPADDDEDVRRTYDEADPIRAFLRHHHRSASEMARHRRAESYSCRQARHLTNVLMETRQDLAGTKQQLDEAIGELGRVRAQLQAEVSRSTKLAAELDSEVGRLVGVIRSRDRIEEERVQVIMVEARNEFEVELAEIHERYRLERCRLMVSNAAALRAVEKTIALMDAELCKRDQRIAMLEAAARDDSRVVAMLARANENQMEHERIRQALQAKVVQIAALNDLSVRRQAAMTSRIASFRADLDRRCDQIRSLMSANESLATALDQARNDVRAQQACMRHEEGRLTLVASEITVWQAKQRDRDEGERFIDSLQTAVRERGQRADALSVKVQSLEQQKAEGDQEIAALQERLRAQFQMQASAQRATEQMRMANQELRREIELRGADCQKTMASELALKESEFNQRLQAELCIQKRNLEGEFGHVQRALVDDAAQHVSLINDLTLQLDDVQERTTTLTAGVKDLVDENRHLQTECIRFADDLANLQCAKQAAEVEAVRQVQDLSDTIAVLIVQERCLRNDLARQTESSAKMMDTTALELQACRQTCDRLEESVAKLQRDRDDLALKLKSVSASEAALVLDRDLLRGQLNDVSRSYEQTLARCELGDAGLDALKTELAEAMADNGCLRNEVLTARSDLVANKDKHVHDMEALNEVINSERRAHQEGVDELELTIDSTNARLEEVRRDLHKALETSQTAERQHVETREFLQKAQRDAQEALHAKDIAEQGQASIQNQLQQVQRDLELSRLAHNQAAAEVKDGAQRYMDLEQKYDEVQSLMHSYKNECDRLRGTIDSKDIASSDLKAELDDARRRITTLMATEDENQRLQDECRRLAGELVELQRAKQGLDGDASRHAQALDEKIAALVSHEASLRDEHAKQMEASFKLTSALESDLRESRQACGRLEGSLAETKHDRNDLAVKLERLSARYSDLEQQHDALQSLVQTYKDECDRLRNAITCNGTASSALQAKLEDAERRVATLTTTEGETQHLRVECHRLARELDDLQRARQVSEEESDHQAQALNETIATLTAQERSFRDEVAKQMEASAQLVAALESDLREHRQTRDCLETSLAQLQRDRDDLVVKVGSLTASEAALVSDCDLLRGQLDELRQSYQEALDRCKRSDNRVEAIKKEQLETVADNDRLRSELESAQTELDANAGQHRCETEGLNDIIRLERSAHQEDVRELQSAVDSALEAKRTIEHEHEATKTLLEKAQKDMNDALHAKRVAEESRDSTWNLLEKAQRDLETCISARDQALAEAEMGTQHYKDLEQERNVLHGLLETSKGECAQLRGSINSNNAVISELRTKVEGAETQAFAMQERLRSLYDQIEALQNELDAAGRTYESRRAVDKQESDRALFQQDVELQEKLVKQKTAMLEEIDALQAQNVSLLAAIRTMEIERAERERADNDIRDESDRRLTESKRTEALLKELIERLQRDMSLVKCAFDQARQEFDAERQILEGRILSATKELADVHEQYKSQFRHASVATKDEIADLRSRLDAEADYRMNMKDELAVVQAECVRLKDELARVVARNSELTSERSVVDARQYEAQRILHEERSRATQEIARLMAQCADLTERSPMPEKKVAALADPVRDMMGLHSVPLAPSQATGCDQDANVSEVPLETMKTNLAERGMSSLRSSAKVNDHIDKSITGSGTSLEKDEYAETTEAFNDPRGVIIGHVASEPVIDACFVPVKAERATSLDQHAMQKRDLSEEAADVWSEIYRPVPVCSASQPSSRHSRKWSNITEASDVMSKVEASSEGYQAARATTPARTTSKAFQHKRVRSACSATSAIRLWALPSQVAEDNCCSLSGIGHPQRVDLDVEMHSSLIGQIEALDRRCHQLEERINQQRLTNAAPTAEALSAIDERSSAVSAPKLPPSYEQVVKDTVATVQSAGNQGTVPAEPKDPSQLSDRVSRLERCVRSSQIQLRAITGALVLIAFSALLNKLNDDIAPRI